VLCLDDARLATACAKQGFAQRALPFDTDEDRAHREFVAWICTHILQVRVEAVFTSEDYGDGFAQVLSDCFSAFDGRKHAVAHVCVDKSRQRIPISGTALRGDIFQHRSWLSPVVYESFVRRVCLLGGESTGKTTLAEALSRRFETTWVPEYGRELWDARLGHLAYEDMAHIAQAQIARESAATADANKWLFCDTSPLTTYFYSQEMFGRVDRALALAATRPYDVVALCSPDFPFVQDGTRKGDEFRQKQHAWYLNELRSRDMEFVLLEGSMPERISMMASLLNGWASAEHLSSKGKV
jgi:NadR type nicotinamide-nucleotide adenylyltransferase